MSAWNDHLASARKHGVSYFEWKLRVSRHGHYIPGTARCGSRFIDWAIASIYGVNKPAIKTV